MEEFEDSGPPRFKGYLSVFCAMVVNLMIGSYYCYSNMNPYVAAYLRSFNPNVTSKDTLLILPIWLVNQSLFAIVGVRLSEKFGYVKVNLAAFVGYTLVNGLMIYVKNYWLFIIVYGFLPGITIGLGYLPSMYIAWTYFPKKKSMVTGVILFTAGISASILSPITTSIVNPDNMADYSTNPTVYNNVPSMFKFLFFYFGALTLVACGFQPEPYTSKTYQEKKQLEKEIEEYKKSLAPSAIPSGNISRGSRHMSRRMSVRNQVMTELDNKRIRIYHNEELKNDLNGVVDPQAAMLMAAIDTDKVVDLVQNKDNLENQVREQVKSMRNSIKLDAKSDQEQIEQIKEKLVETNIQNIYRTSTLLLSKECPSVRIGLKSKVYLQVAIMAFGCSIINYFLNSVWKDFYRSKFSVEDDKMALLLSMGGFSNSIARLVAGALLMRYTFKSIFLCLVCVVIFTCITVNFWATTYGAGAFYLLLVFGGIGTQVTIFPTMTTKVFGATTGPKIYPYVYLIFSIANITQYLILKVFSNWSVMFILFGACAVAALVVGINFNENPDWRGNIEQELFELQDNPTPKIPESKSRAEMEVYRQDKN